MVSNTSRKFAFFYKILISYFYLNIKKKTNQKQSIKNHVLKFKKK